MHHYKLKEKAKEYNKQIKHHELQILQGLEELFELGRMIAEKEKKKAEAREELDKEIRELEEERQRIELEIRKHRIERDFLIREYEILMNL